MSASPTELLHLAKQAASAGADVLARRTVEALGSQNKSSDSDWVTAFDLAAERAVRNVISRSRPHDVITGEELGTTVPDRASGTDRVRWSIDPLDGTTNFIRNIVYYCTSVAAADADGRWLAGVVHAPALDRVYWAAAGQGAWVRDHGRITRLAGPESGRIGALLGTGFTYDAASRAQQVGELSSLLAGFGDVRRLGSAALDLCMVADGTLDGYLERGLNEHDWAAGALIAEEAGAAVLRPDLTSELDGGPDAAERFGGVTAAGTPQLVQRAAALTLNPSGSSE
ncbi:myo-inositol-1(or 4)-monophosphatase [Arthrobacter sp. CAN_A212]|uniref:inositol monophosphatase family protein n=1 Tax=unclassified Arthrobacter TaxID=235627 RepID=UPI0018CB9421|nr:inositol monophosphatase family protein [Arthrobacter sp. CAN_C5]MBP2217698.1 myo-inositol-1(or 4)-monophosphatase [Arthrobacter sp. CAN_C5]